MKDVLILLGPTAVGKTGASIRVAKALDTEIISADSMQIYRGMDIGTAKPTSEEREGVVHHMIDIVEPSESFSAGQFVDLVVPIINSLHKEGRLPIIVGGNGLYIRAVTRGIFSGPSADWALREELLAKEMDDEGYLYRSLLKLDPDAASRIEPNDKRRLVRSLEVCLKSGEKMSYLQQMLTKPLPYNFIRIGLTRDRRELYKMIDRRVDSMIEAGLIEETRRLLTSNPDRTPLQAIGYKELSLFLEGSLPLQEALRLIKRNSRRYAKRQFTWFRKDPCIHWVNITGIRDNVLISSLVLSAFGQASAYETSGDRGNVCRMPPG